MWPRSLISHTVCLPWHHKRQITKVTLVTLGVLLVLTAINNMVPHTPAYEDSSVNNTIFHRILRERASDQDIIFLASVDSGYMDLAFNLYFTSFDKLGITNYLFVGSDSSVCQKMKQHNIACYEYMHDKEAEEASSYFSYAFKRKTHLKTKIILEALNIGLKVIITDVDIVFLKDPTPYLDCEDCDIEISNDVSEGNSGFYIARPTTSCIRLHANAWKQGIVTPKLSNQKVLDRNIERMDSNGELKVRYLDQQLFANGAVFFEEGRRMFKADNPPDNIVIVHNNWIESIQAKINRFKEYGLWEYDAEGYYSNEHRKYLIFDLPEDFGERETPKQELESLRTALIVGDVLNRTVIMPQFHCYSCTDNEICDRQGSRCMFGTFHRIDVFDNIFKNKYRESVFFSHRLVPKTVQNSKSRMYFILSDDNKHLVPYLSKYIQVFEPSSVPNGPTVDEIRQWFIGETTSILVFHSLYNKLKIDRDFASKVSVASQINAAITESTYRQFY